MRTALLSEVLKIERQVQLMPWARLSFEQSLNRDDCCKVIQSPGTLAGFYVCSSVVDEVHLLNIAVASEWQGIGLGHLLMQDIVNSAENIGAKKIFLEVRESNAGARSLYEKWQFNQIAVRKNYYRTPDKHRENAIVCVRLL